MRQFAVVKNATLLLCALLPYPGVIWADDPAAPVYRVETADGKVIDGRLRELKPDWSIHLDTGVTVAGADLLSVRQLGKSLPAQPIQPHLLLSGGDCIPVDWPILIGERVHFHSPHFADGKDASAPLSSVTVIWLAATASESAERLRRRLATETRKRDVVLLKNGDALEGVLTSLDEKTVGIEVDQKPVAVAVGQTAAIALSSDLTEPLRSKGEYSRLILNGDRARLSLASARCTDGVTITGTTLFGASLNVALSDVASLTVFNGKAVYLSDLKPSRYEYLSYLDDWWDAIRDGSAAGLDLRLAGSTYDKGIGVHSHSRVFYAVPPGSRRFEALVGLDDRSGRRGRVRIRVLIDGKQLDVAGNKEQTAADDPLVIGADVTGVKELMLEVDFGKNGPVGGCIDWVNARFIK